MNENKNQNKSQSRNNIKITKLGLSKIFSNVLLLLFMISYTSILILMFKFRNYIYILIPFDTSFKYFYIIDMIINIIIYILLILCFWLPILVIGKSGINKYDTDFEEQGFINKKGFPPDRVSEKNNNKEIKHSKKLEFLANNIPLNTWKDNILKIEQALDLYINYIEYSKITKKHIIIKGVPTKYYKPAILTTKNNFLCESINGVFVGPTGSGKSYAILSFIGKIATYNPSNTCIYLCDPKRDDENFMQFEGATNYYIGIEKSVVGINSFYDEFVYRRDTNDKERKKQLAYLFVDEYSMLLSSLDDKTSKDIKSKIGELLRAGRSLNCRVFIGLQNAYSEFFEKSRDNLQLRIALGTISKEEKGMMFDRYKEKMVKECGKGEGYIYRVGIGLEEIKVISIDNIDIINKNIKELLSNEFGDKNKIDN